MNSLIQPDLNQVPFATDSFLGRALALGRQFGRLPDYLGEALMTYLRAQALAFAQRYRSGIAIGRDRLERGVKQALTCVELGLEEAAAGDLNRAVDLLASGDFEPLRQRGWELAWARLAHMRAQARAWSKCKELRFLQDSNEQVERWSRIAPEAWASQGHHGKEEWIDLRQEYLAFQDLESRLRFLGSLPGESLDGLLQAAPEGGNFAEVLRQLILVLALDLERLAVKRRDVRRFQRAYFSGGKMLPQVRQKVLGLIAGHLEKTLTEVEGRAAIQRETEVQIELLERASQGDLESLFIAVPSTSPPAPSPAKRTSPGQL